MNLVYLVIVSNYILIKTVVMRFVFTTAIFVFEVSRILQRAIVKYET